MAAPSSTFTELVSTTFRNHSKEIKDNLSNRNALLKFIMKKGNYKTESGGTEITIPLDYAANNTYQRYSDWDIIPPRPRYIHRYSAMRQLPLRYCVIHGLFPAM